MKDRADRALAAAEQGRALARDGRVAEAAARLREAVALEASTARRHDLGVLYNLLGDFPAAEAELRQALSLEPSHPRCRAALGLALLGQGRLAEGFGFYDAWREIPDNPVTPAPDLGAPVWSGEPLAGRSVLIWGEEGFGDQIMYARFAPLLQAQGAQVIWVCHPALARLARDGLGVESIPTQKGALSISGLDFAAPTSRLPVVFMQRLRTPPPAPYLTSPPPIVIQGQTIGVVTRGNPQHDNDRNRSLPPAAAAELMALPGVVSLLPEDTGARDFWDTAAIIAGLDLVISVDTSAAHLAGALGKPVWLLLPAIGCDWRWGTDRNDSAWYGAMRLFRQTTPGDWTGVLDQVRAELRG